tara:strand:+ start:11932 stop:12060 length:129 start_codon:yes stop_codon:yes gene_type:complete
MGEALFLKFPVLEMHLESPNKVKKFLSYSLKRVKNKEQKVNN